MSAKASYRRVARTALREGAIVEGERAVPEEVPVAFSYGGSTHAVMMASPADLVDFAVGFSLTEGIISTRAEIRSIEVIEAGQGFDVQVDLQDANADALKARRRHMAGPVGCGLCGIESIEQAVRVVPELSGVEVSVEGDDIVAAVKALNEAQSLNRETRAVHGAGFYNPQKGCLLSAKMSAATMRSTSSQVRSSMRTYRPIRALWLSPAACRWKWSRRRPFLAAPFWRRSPRPLRLPSKRPRVRVSHLWRWCGVKILKSSPGRIVSFYNIAAAVSRRPLASERA